MKTLGLSIGKPAPSLADGMGSEGILPFDPKWGCNAWVIDQYIEAEKIVADNRQRTRYGMGALFFLEYLACITTSKSRAYR
jgi:hypothetical protein